MRKGKGEGDEKGAGNDGQRADEEGKERKEGGRGRRRIIKGRVTLSRELTHAL